MEEWSYKKAGVNIDAGNEAARRIRQHLQATRNLLVRGEEGGFGGLCLPSGILKPSWWPVPTGRNKTKSGLRHEQA